MPIEHARTAGHHNGGARHASLGGSTPHETAPPPMPKTSTGLEVTRSRRRAWHPVAVLLLGILFTPLWTGVMAAINVGRLHTGKPRWRPVVLGIGSLLLAIGLFTAGIDALIVLFAAMWSGLIFIGVLDVASQLRAYYGTTEVERHSELVGWVVPCLGGAPGLFVILLFATLALLPLSPIEVSEKFMRADTSTAAGAFVTDDLQPALEELDRANRKVWQCVDCKLVEATEAPPEIGGYGVAYAISPKNVNLRYGRFAIHHLFRVDGEWKVGELYFADSIENGSDDWLALTTHYMSWLPPPQPVAEASVPHFNTPLGDLQSNPFQLPPVPRKSAWEQLKDSPASSYGIWKTLTASGKVWPKVGAAILALIAGTASAAKMRGKRGS